MLKHLLIFALYVTFAVVGSGCASAPARVRHVISPDNPESFEKAAFDVLSDYYCAQKMWPTTWAQVEEFQRQRGEDAKWLQIAKQPTLSSTRAILLTLSYNTERGLKRRATYIAPPRCGKESNGDFVSVAAEGVVFRLPEGFELLRLAELKSKWKRPPYPDAAWGTQDGLILAIRFGDVEIKPGELPELDKDIAEAYEASIPSLVWTFKESKVIDGKPVLYHEFQSTTSTGPILNVVISSTFDSRLFAITITGPSEKSDVVVQTARHIEQSLKIR